MSPRVKNDTVVCSPAAISATDTAVSELPLKRINGASPPRKAVRLRNTDSPMIRILKTPYAAGATGIAEQIASGATRVATVSAIEIRAMTPMITLRTNSFFMLRLSS